VDLVETDDGLRVIEINTGAEFKGLVEATGVDVPAAIVEYLKRRGREMEVRGERLGARPS
jgi:[lysine-biosynthesis-protein LysW]--L-2-aminoadipate ligase